MKDSYSPGNGLSLPFYAKASLIVLGLFVFLYMLYIGQEIIVPLIFSAMIAIIMHPQVEFFNRLGLHRVLSISLVIFLSIAVITGIIFIVFSQASMFVNSWPELAKKFEEMLNLAIHWVSSLLKISPGSVNNWISNTMNEIMKFSSGALGTTLLSLGNAIVVIVLIPVYVFLFLYYQPLLMEFIRNLFGKQNREEVGVITKETKSIIQQYLIGLLIEFVIITILNTIGLWVLGIPYALLLGVIGSILNIIPYVGGIIGVALYMIVALVTVSPTTSLLVLALYGIIQFLDNNVIMPRIVASKVKLNALISIVIVIAGGMFWGISGMFLSIPLFAIIKLIFDRIELLKPWGYLMGSSMAYQEEEFVVKDNKKKQQNTSRFPQ